MPIAHQIYDTATLLGVYRDMPSASTYFLDLGFGSSVTFEDEFIDFEKLVGNRKLAPFVAPTAQGVPIYSQGSEVTRLKPAYVKPKDAVEPSRLFKRAPGNLLGNNTQNPLARYNALVAAIMQDHREAIERRWEWLAARALIDGKVTIEDDRYPARVVDFKRDASHTVTLTGTARWGQADAKIIGNIESWRGKVRNAKFGGPTNRMTVASDVWDVMRADPEVLKQLDTQIRGTSMDVNIGIREGSQVEYIGKLSNTLELWINSDYYELPNGTTAPYMEPGTVLLSGPNVMGVRAFGAIVDKKANFQATPVFPKMWEQEDPSATFIMTQSAPLMVPVNPNNTLKAKVL